jgi:hypothetical protein
MCIHTFVPQNELFCVINNSVTCNNHTGGQVLWNFPGTIWPKLHTNLNNSYSEDRMTTAGIRSEGPESLALHTHPLV